MGLISHNCLIDYVKLIVAFLVGPMHKVVTLDELNYSHFTFSHSKWVFS
jgi:hypothetical protein